MKRKIPVILILTLLLATAILPASGNVNLDKNEMGEQHLVDEQKVTTTGDDVDWWPMFHHDLENTGNSTSPHAPDTNNVLWTYTTGFVVSSSPAIFEDKVYIGSDDEYFYCLDAITGDKLWNYPIPGGTSLSSPCVADGKVYVGTTYYNFFCWNADTGDLEWNSPKPYGGSSSPAVSNGRVFIAKSRGNTGNNGYVYCLDANTGAEIWDYNMGFYELSSPVIYNGKVYFGSEDRNLYCFDAEFGTLLWNFYMNGAVLSSPAVVDGKVYAGGGWLNGFTGKFYCLDAETGVEFWHYNSSTFSSPAISYDKIYFVSNYMGVLCLDADTGDLLWQYNIGSSYEHDFSSPTVADGKIYVGIWSNGELLCLNAESGDKIWAYTVSPGSPSHLFSSPAAADGKVYVGGGFSYKIYAFQDPSEPPLPPNIYGPTNGIVNISYEFTFVSVDPEGDDVFYYIDWDDGTPSVWIGPYLSGEEVTMNHLWSVPGIYNIRAKAKDSYGVMSNWSDPFTLIIIVDNYPPDTPRITGPTRGKAGVEYTYCVINATDPDGDDIWANFSWGDGTYSGWIGPNASGEDICATHAWERGNYGLRVKLKDEWGLESPWSVHLPITIPKNKPFDFNLDLLSWLFERFPNAFPILRHILGL